MVSDSTKHSENVTHERFAVEFEMTTVGRSETLGECAWFCGTGQSDKCSQQRNRAEPHVFLDPLSIRMLFILVSPSECRQEYLGRSSDGDFLCSCFLWILSFQIQGGGKCEPISFSRSQRDSEGVRLLTFAGVRSSPGATSGAQIYCSNNYQISVSCWQSAQVF